jgi:acid phosphatase
MILSAPARLAAFVVLLSSTTLAQNTATGTLDVAKAAATAKTSSPTTNVKGKAFDRFAVVWLENTNFDKAAGDRESSALLSHLVWIVTNDGLGL